MQLPICLKKNKKYEIKKLNKENENIKEEKSKFDKKDEIFQNKINELEKNKKKMKIL